MLIDRNYKKLGISVEYAKCEKDVSFVVFDTEKDAVIFAQFIDAQSVKECTDGFLIGWNGTLIITSAWYNMLLEAKKRFNIEWRKV